MFAYFFFSMLCLSSFPDIGTEVYKTENLTVYSPKEPRVPHHLKIGLNRDIQSFVEISVEENRELFATMNKVAEIYKTVDIHGFVVARYDKPQEKGRHIVELIPHLPGFSEVKNMVDKWDCNRYVLFRNAPISAVRYEIKPEEVLVQAQFWKKAFEQPQNPLNESDLVIQLPFTRFESHQKEAEEMLHQHLAELAKERIPSFLTMPTHIETIKQIEVSKCPFCDLKNLEKQCIYENDQVYVLYNIRKGTEPATAFLILPKRHTEKIYGLNKAEIDAIATLRSALTEVLKQRHPGHEVVVYIQDSPSVGQTVFHSHEQIVAIDPKTVALSWMQMCLFPGVNSEEEIKLVQKEFSEALQKKLEEFAAPKKAA